MFDDDSGTASWMQRQSGSGSGRNKKHDQSKDSELLGEYFYLYSIVFASLIIPLLGSIREKPWYSISRRLVIQDIVFRIPDLTPLLFPSRKSKTNKIKMSLIELKTLTNDDLKKHLSEQIIIEDWPDKRCKCKKSTQTCYPYGKTKIPRST